MQLNPRQLPFPHRRERSKSHVKCHCGNLGSCVAAGAQHGFREMQTSRGSRYRTSLFCEHRLVTLTVRWNRLPVDVWRQRDVAECVEYGGKRLYGMEAKRSFAELP